MLTRCLLDRQTARRPSKNRTIQSNAVRECLFRRLELKESSVDSKLSFEQDEHSSSKIVELVSTEEFLMALSADGCCFIYEKRNLERRRRLLNHPNECVQSLFYNRKKKSILYVYLKRDDPHCRLRISSISLRNLRLRRPTNRLQILSKEILHCGSFVEFDPNNEIILTFSPTKRVFKVWDLLTYKLRFYFSSEEVEEVKISQGLLLVIYKRKKSHVSLRVLCVFTGKVLRSLNHMLRRNRKIDFIDQFLDKIILKQDGESMQIINLRSKKVTVSQLRRATSILFLNKTPLLLAFRDKSLEAWKFSGEDFTRISLEQEASLVKSLTLSKDQRYLMLYHKDSKSRDRISVSEIESGRRIATLKISNSKIDNNMRVTPQQTSITAMCYCDERNELYVGRRNGCVQLFAAS